MFLRTIARKFALAGLLAVSTLAAQTPGGPPGGRRGFGPGPGLSLLPELTGKTVTGAPFSALATTQIQRTLTNGNQIQQQQQTNVYRDGQGRVRTDTTITRPANSSGQTTVTESVIFDPVGSFVYRLDSQNKTALQTPIRQRPSLPAGNPPAGQSGSVQVQTQDLGTQTVNGVSATGTQVTRTIPAGTIGNSQPIQTVTVTWTSTALQIPVQITITDPRFGNTTLNLTNIIQAEPDPSLFQVPPDYKVITAPAGMMRRFGQQR